LISCAQFASGGPYIFGRKFLCFDVAGFSPVGKLKTGSGNERFEPLPVTWWVRNHAGSIFQMGFTVTILQ
jgi:hypothetical protein